MTPSSLDAKFRKENRSLGIDYTLRSTSREYSLRWPVLLRFELVLLFPFQQFISGWLVPKLLNNVTCIGGLILYTIMHENNEEPYL
jgi:hypothetical protein